MNILNTYDFLCRGLIEAVPQIVYLKKIDVLIKPNLNKYRVKGVGCPSRKTNNFKGSRSRYKEYNIPEDEGVTLSII